MQRQGGCDGVQQRPVGASLVLFLFRRRWERRRNSEEAGKGLEQSWEALCGRASRSGSLRQWRRLVVIRDDSRDRAWVDVGKGYGGSRRDAFIGRRVAWVDGAARWSSRAASH